MYMDKSVKSSVLSASKVTLENWSQTEQSQMINYACTLFMKELEDMISEEKEQEEEMKVQEIINKAQHIIVRIKNKAAPSHGLSNAEFASQNPQSPVIGGRRTSPNKSWHFDVGTSSQKKQLMNVVAQKVTTRYPKHMHLSVTSNNNKQ